MSKFAEQEYSRFWYRAGQMLQGIILGFLLIPAVFELAALVGNISAFKYQGF